MATCCGAHFATALAARAGQAAASRSDLSSSSAYCQRCFSGLQVADRSGSSSRPQYLRRVHCQAVEPAQSSTPQPPLPSPTPLPPSEAANAAAAALNGAPVASEWVNFNLDKRTPTRPEGWVDKPKKESQVMIRRRPPTGPPTHAVGPFEFRMENEDNIPRNILEEIVWHKDIEITKAKEKEPLARLIKQLGPHIPPPRDFVGALRARAEETGVPGLIAEVKKASPSKGIIQPNFDPVKIAAAYQKGGAACLSVLTDEKFFQGSFENLKKIRYSGCKLPLLCKEFIVDAYQLFKARTVGADAVLLIAAVLPDTDIKYMLKVLKTLKMAALVEVHTEEEMDRVLAIDGIEMIGINNRDLGTFKVDIQNTVRLLEGERGRKIREKNILVVGESGLFVPEDIAVVQGAGCGAVLVGESLVKQDDPAAGIAGLFGKGISRSSS